MIAAGFLAGSIDILENNLIEERMTQYRAEELATSIGILTQYGEERPALMEKRFQQEYEIEFLDAGGGENMTLTTAEEPPTTVEVSVPTEMDLPSKVITDEVICINKSRRTASNPEKVKIDAGSC